MTGVLDGLRVLDLAREDSPGRWQGSTCPTRGRRSSRWSHRAATRPGPCRRRGCWNRGKKSVILDLKDAGSKDPFERLVRGLPTCCSRASGPAPWTGLGLSYDALHAITGG